MCRFQSKIFLLNWHIIAEDNKILKLLVTEDDRNGFHNKNVNIVIGTLLILHFIMMNFHYIDEKKIISYKDNYYPRLMDVHITINLINYHTHTHIYCYIDFSQKKKTLNKGRS